MIDKQKQIHQNHRNRMKNTFLDKGLEAFSDIQKLEFLLFFAIPQKDVNPIAHNLLDAFGTLTNVFNADFTDLVKVDGIGKHTALLIKTCQQFAGIYSASNANLPQLSSSNLAKQYCYHLLRNSGVEEFYVICLDNSNKILKTKKISTGNSNKVNVEISDLTKLAFSLKASGVIIAHNHPSGNLQFSDEDLLLTHNIICSCLLNGIKLVDHILVTPFSSKSLAEAGQVEAIENSAFKKLNVKFSPSQLASKREPYIISKN